MDRELDFIVQSGGMVGYLNKFVVSCGRVSLVPGGVGEQCCVGRRVSGQTSKTTHIGDTPGRPIRHGRWGPTVIYTDYLTTVSVPRLQSTTHEPIRVSESRCEGESGRPVSPPLFCEYRSVRT